MERARILLVDDEPLLLRSLARQLHKHHDVVPASGGTEALMLLRADILFDVIVCDISMPDMDGMSLHKELLRTMPQLAGRMVFTSGGLLSTEAREFVQVNTNPMLQKPFEFMEVLALIEHVMRGSP